MSVGAAWADSIQPKRAFVPPMSPTRRGKLTACMDALDPLCSCCIDADTFAPDLHRIKACPSRPHVTRNVAKLLSDLTERPRRVHVARLRKNPEFLAQPSKTSTNPRLPFVVPLLD